GVEFERQLFGERRQCRVPSGAFGPPAGRGVPLGGAAHRTEANDCSPPACKGTFLTPNEVKGSLFHTAVGGPALGCAPVGFFVVPSSMPEGPTDPARAPTDPARAPTDPARTGIAPRHRWPIEAVLFDFHGTVAQVEDPVDWVSAAARECGVRLDRAPAIALADR